MIILCIPFVLSLKNWKNIHGEVFVSLSLVGPRFSIQICMYLSFSPESEPDEGSFVPASRAIDRHLCLHFSTTTIHSMNSPPPPLTPGHTRFIPLFLSSRLSVVSIRTTFLFTRYSSYLNTHKALMTLFLLLSIQLIRNSNLFREMGTNTQNSSRENSLAIIDDNIAGHR